MKLILFLFFLFAFWLKCFALANNCHLNQHWVSAYHRSEYYRADGTFVRAAEVKAHCRENPESYKFWEDRISNVSPETWPHRTERAKKWTVEEKERVLEAICELPEEIWKKSEYKFYRMERSKDGENPSTSGEKILVLYDSAFSKMNKLSQVLAYEFSHEIYRTLEKGNYLKKYYEVTFWFYWDNKNGQRTWISGRENFVLDDGRTSPAEDFANNLEFFLFDPDKLKTVTPAAFKWFKELYGDKLKIRSCKNEVFNIIFFFSDLLLFVERN